MGHQFKLVGKINKTEVWRGYHRGPHKSLTFYIVVQCRYHSWYAWLVASNDGWDDDSYSHVNAKKRKTEDQEVAELLNDVINDQEKEPHPPTFHVYAGGKDANDARERLITVLARVGEVMATSGETKKKVKKGKVTADENA